MRVLQVIGVMDRGGAETMVMNLYRAMNRDEIQFDFLVHEEREGDYDEEIRSLGGRFFRLPRFNGTNGLAYRKRCRALFAEHPEWGIVHGHIGSSAPIYLGEAKRVGRYAIAHSHAQNYEGGLAGLAFRAVAHPVRYVADYFMACSREAGLDRFGRSIVGGDRFSILPNGIDAGRYACDQAEHEKAKTALGLSGRPVVCHVGRLIPVKNHEFLFRVFAQVLEKKPDAVLLLAGRGELEQSLKQLATELGLADAIRFLGVVEDVPSILRAADVFVFPSIREGLAVAVVEAQAAGLPTLVSGGVPDLALVSDRVEKVPLEVGAGVWAETCLQKLDEVARGKRDDAVAQVRMCGFDIADTSAKLAAFYSEHAPSCGVLR